MLYLKLNNGDILSCPELETFTDGRDQIKVKISDTDIEQPFSFFLAHKGISTRITDLNQLTTYPSNLPYDVTATLGGTTNTFLIRTIFNNNVLSFPNRFNSLAIFGVNSEIPMQDLYAAYGFTGENVPAYFIVIPCCVRDNSNNIFIIPTGVTPISQSGKYVNNQRTPEPIFDIIDDPIYNKEDNTLRAGKARFNARSYVSGIDLDTVWYLSVKAQAVYPEGIAPSYTIYPGDGNLDPPTPIPPVAPSDNPYAPGGTSGAGGGNGTFDRTSDPVPFTDLPTLTAARAGMISLFNPTLSELQSLSARLWSKDFLDAFVNYFTDPSEIIISLGIVPVSPPISGRSDLQAGLISTGIEMNTVSSQFMSFNLGSMDVLPFYDAALDYAPFTKISVFLPYIGVRQLNTDEVMNNKVEIQYNIDLFSGACVAEIKVGESVLYSFNGNILSSVPVSARSFDSLISAVINGATAIGGAIATGGATAGLAISATVNAVQASKPEILRSGNASANIGLLAGQRAYLIFEIPNQSMPENNQTFVGFPSNISAKLGDLTGFTQVDTIHLENIPATNNEITEIENLLRQGVIL